MKQETETINSELSESAGSHQQRSDHADNETAITPEVCEEKIRISVGFCRSSLKIVTFLYSDAAIVLSPICRSRSMPANFRILADTDLQMHPEEQNARFSAELTSVARVIKFYLF
ncbi:MAG: hypothetical protein KME07_18775 [Pegethrix bostrychoides GSE-TBD4-15B]|jgi:hypothetical protein|uniref:Uncharacterized protein n=1 Tax=Pegethrix bostrychoides GSE-TBD4-15B TaxID=2839662 RepID=A0A951U6B8_9CYAN|nr:hypothetical protein [Pegethrix bostrychoides GSE-TBD4-15B]